METKQSVKFKIHQLDPSTDLGLSKQLTGLTNVDNTSDLNKPISTATQAALDLKANSASPTLTGVVKITGLTTTNPAVAGQLWSNNGVLTVSAG